MTAVTIIFALIGKFSAYVCTYIRCVSKVNGAIKIAYLPKTLQRELWWDTVGSTVRITTVWMIRENQQNRNNKCLDINSSHYNCSNVTGPIETALIKIDLIATAWGWAGQIATGQISTG
jgi:hypothetical protein